MGVPAFFRWLSRKYPSVIIECEEKKTMDDQGNPIFEDPTLPNPNGVEFDNLYLDMNGIIHPCTHPEDKPAPKNEDEMMVAIFECIDRLFAIVRPRKLLYMAIDGVAPRAKMNQQRSRRFRAAKEATEKQLTITTIRAELSARGIPLPPEKPKEEHFDSNCITPGTPFMERLSICLHYYIHERMNSNPGWKKIKVILSDANVPGEGEHKLMDYIRRQRAQPDHDPNTQHVLCGADADLIMLGLATHEPNFTIIREEFLPNKPRPCDICGGFGHEMIKCDGLGDTDSKADIAISKEVQFIFVRLPVLKEYLKEELLMPNLPFKYDFERVLDDWVFMCFFVGNDFLPHLPSLEIRENAIDRLITLYKKCVYKTGGYLTDSGDVNLDRVQMIMNDLGLVEDEIFKNRKQTEESFKAREKAKKRRMENQQRPNFNQMNNSRFAPNPVGRGYQPDHIQNPRQEIAKFRTQSMQSNNFQSAIERKLDNSKPSLETMLRPQSESCGSSGQNEKHGQKRKGEDEPEEEEEPNDEVRLWEDGFKDRYYESKFDVKPDNLEFRYSVALQYVRGLCWVLKYYYQGCASWKWYFPYHYAPFASDFVNITGLSTQFEKYTIPFNPLEQLMGVFPAASCTHVPEPWRHLMSEPKSSIIDFYPEDFTIDLNGKKFAWQGVALLPFVDENRLFAALKPYYNRLTDRERKRNMKGDSRLFVGPQNSGYAFIKGLYTNKISEIEETKTSIDGMQGLLLVAEDCVGINDSLDSPVAGLYTIENNKVLSVKYRDPVYDEDFIFPAKRLPNAIDPPTVLREKGNQGNQGNRNYRPQIGFSQNSSRASLGDAGHRMVNRGFAAIPPPRDGAGGGGYQQSNNQWQSRNNYNQQGGRSFQGQNRNYGAGGDAGNNFQRQNYGGGNNFNNQQRGNSFQQSNNWASNNSQDRNQSQSNWRVGNNGSGNGGGGGNRGGNDQQNWRNRGSEQGRGGGGGYKRY